jgi:hypothetical protein
MANPILYDEVTTMADVNVCERQFDRKLLPPSTHPFADLLAMSPSEIHERYTQQQHLEFFDTVDKLFADDPDPAGALPLIADLRAIPGIDGLRDRLDREAVCARFERLHKHVLGHPVWMHPFFVRFAEGDLARAQFRRFLSQYLNQIKNTRQCVALALGRLNSLELDIADIDGHALLAERISEQTQVVLAGILADEYGVAARPTGSGEHDELAGDMFSSVTHVELYRRLFELIDVPLADQDVPLLPSTADNVLIQRLIAGDRRFDQLEALASVGMAMEWGVPVFFSMLLRGVLLFADKNGIMVEPRQVEVLTGHVRQDVEHAVGVMLVAALWVRSEADMRRIMDTASAVMAGRYAMMTAIFEDTFGEPCPHLESLPIDPDYQLADRRILAALAEARSMADPSRIASNDYPADAVHLPFGTAIVEVAA